ncbi:hypothetical protein [Oleiphilus sp. HI0061]|uniref:hypothetical protein n=1 Tax=Oleiphilus sp. HI0061 TaxID=1822239 RepID=UPI000AFE57CF|nr:hypothetical protein [Oleiphilus sp. HI0061]
MSEFEIDASRYVLGGSDKNVQETPALLSVNAEFKYVCYQCGASRCGAPTL